MSSSVDATPRLHRRDAEVAEKTKKAGKFLQENKKLAESSTKPM